LSSLAACAATAFLTSGAAAKLGRRLSFLGPDPSGNGRALAIRPGTSIGYFTFEGAQNPIYKINMRTGKPAGHLTTDLRHACRCSSSSDFGFGALSWQGSKHILWGSEYGLGTGWIDKINPATGHVTRGFNARHFNRQNSDIDGLAVDSDGTLWVSGDESLVVYHFTARGKKLGSFKLPFTNSGIAVDGGRLWMVDYPDAQLRAYSKSGRPIRGLHFSIVDYTPFPEDLAIDTCTFRGKKAIWVYSAGTAGVMAAYQIGRSSNAGCRS
jgi:outer membrane protein assembly factor BamB